MSALLLLATAFVAAALSTRTMGMGTLYSTANNGTLVTFKWDAPQTYLNSVANPNVPGWFSMAANSKEAFFLGNTGPNFYVDVISVATLGMVNRTHISNMGAIHSLQWDGAGGRLLAVGFQNPHGVVVALDLSTGLATPVAVVHNNPGTTGQAVWDEVDRFFYISYIISLDECLLARVSVTSEPIQYFNATCAFMAEYGYVGAFNQATKSITSVIGLEVISEAIPSLVPTNITSIPLPELCFPFGSSAVVGNDIYVPFVIHHRPPYGRLVRLAFTPGSPTPLVTISDPMRDIFVLVANIPS